MFQRKKYVFVAGSKDGGCREVAIEADNFEEALVCAAFRATRMGPQRVVSLKLDREEDLADL